MVQWKTPKPSNRLVNAILQSLLGKKFRALCNSASTEKKQDSWNELSCNWNFPLQRRAIWKLRMCCKRRPETGECGELQSSLVARKSHSALRRSRDFCYAVRH